MASISVIQNFNKGCFQASFFLLICKWRKSSRVGKDLGVAHSTGTGTKITS